MLLTFTDLVSLPLPLRLRDIHLLFILCHRKKGDSTMEDIWRYMRPLSYILYFPPHIWPSGLLPTHLAVSLRCADNTNSRFLRRPIMHPFLSCPCSSRYVPLPLTAYSVRSYQPVCRLVARVLSSLARGLFIFNRPSGHGVGDVRAPWQHRQCNANAFWQCLQNKHECVLTTCFRGKAEGSCCHP